MTSDRDLTIWRRVKAGETQGKMASIYGISRGRVHQIILGHRCRLNREYRLRSIDIEKKHKEMAVQDFQGAGMLWFIAKCAHSEGLSRSDVVSRLQAQIAGAFFDPCETENEKKIWRWE